VCSFCLETHAACNAAADAARTGSLVLVRDQGGFAHVAVPLRLGRQNLGTLLAGQVLNGYPEVLPLERVARDFGLSPQRVWSLARQQAPISRAHLTTIAELLLVLGQTFLQDRYGSFLERKWTGKAIDSNRELATLSATLTRKVVELDRSIVEKDILLREVHHRVNNNLQVVSSLLSLQIEREDTVVAARLRDAYDRIHSMSLVHEYIHRSTTLADLDFGEYVENLAEHLYESYCHDQQRIKLEIAAESMRLVIDQAIPCGLILNELISNAFKHAFCDGRDGLLEIVFRRVKDHEALLIVTDNGKGLPTTFDANSTKSMGMQVVMMLTRQMEATLEITQESGTRFALSWTAPDTLPALKM
jgi:two-component sensor histidine kinase